MEHVVDSLIGLSIVLGAYIAWKQGHFREW